MLEIRSLNERPFATVRDEAFSLEMVRLFAERINLFDQQECLIAHLHERQYSAALEDCNRAIKACLQAASRQGIPDNVTRRSLSYRQLFHLYQMIENFIVCLEPDHVQ